MTEPTNYANTGNEGVNRLYRKVKAQRDEIDRLALEVEHHRVMSAARQQEVERLLLSNNQLHGECGHLIADCEEQREEVERLKRELVTAHNAIISDVNQQRDLAECRRLLREAVLRDGLVDERWFREANKAGGE